SCGRRSPGLRTDGIIRAIDNVPESVERPPDRQIGFPIAIVIRWRGNVIVGSEGGAPIHLADLVIGALKDDPISIVTKDGQVGFPVTVVIGWDGAIAGRSQVLSANRIIGAVDDVPVAITRTPNCHVCFTVAVEISGYRHVVIGRKSG